MHLYSLNMLVLFVLAAHLHFISHATLHTNCMQTKENAFQIPKQRKGLSSTQHNINTPTSVMTNFITLALAHRAHVFYTECHKNPCIYTRNRAIGTFSSYKWNGIE